MQHLPHKPCYEGPLLLLPLPPALIFLIRPFYYSDRMSLCSLPMHFLLIALHMRQILTLCGAALHVAQIPQMSPHARVSA